MRIFKRQSTKLKAVLCAGLLFSLAGIVYAVCWGSPGDGGRGGAMAVALAFAALFTSAPSLQELLEAPKEDGTPGFDELESQDKIKRLRSAVALVADTQREQNIYLVITSVVGTLVWAFGDVVAVWFGAAAPVTP